MMCDLTWLMIAADSTQQAKLNVWSDFKEKWSKTAGKLQNFLLSSILVNFGQR
jgi:hypothetical protein